MSTDIHASRVAELLASRRCGSEQTPTLCRQHIWLRGQSRRNSLPGEGTSNDADTLARPHATDTFCRCGVAGMPIGGHSMLRSPKDLEKCVIGSTFEPDT